MTKVKMMQWGMILLNNEKTEIRISSIGEKVICNSLSVIRAKMLYF